MKINFNRLDRQYEMFKDEYLEKIKKFFETGYYILGPEVSNFEREFAQYNHSKFCVGVASGLDALILSFRVLGLKNEDEVIVPANTYIATIMGITINGITPVFVEPDEYYNLDADKIEAAITKNTKAICVVHLYGQIANMEKIMNIANKHNLKVIEDVAQAHGAMLNGKKAGTFGEIGCFSFYPTKNLGGFGDGGAIITDDEKISEQFKMLRNYGSKKTYYFEEIGINSRLDELQAALLRVKLKYLDKLNEERKTIAEQFIKRINNNKIVLPKLYNSYEGHVFHLFVVYVIDNRDYFVDFLKSKGIETKIHYPQPPHLSEAYRYLNYKEGDFIITEKMANHCVSLPIYNGMKEDELDYIIDTVNHY